MTIKHHGDSSIRTPPNQATIAPVRLENPFRPSLAGKIWGVPENGGTPTAGWFIYVYFMGNPTKNG